jgi:hypothetical protein|tara:strand:- start:97 stop:615 length:519 start_codon:yes stop_codon:yes gene_type:complete
MITLTKSLAGKFVLSIGLICMILSAYKYYNFFIVLAEGLLFIYFAKTIDCGLYGGCYITSVFPILITSIIALFLIFDYFGIFDKYKYAIQKLYALFENSNEPHLKQLLFPEDSHISERYKRRYAPKLFNKNYRYNREYNSKIYKHHKKEAIAFRTKILDDTNIIINRLNLNN